MKMLMMAAVSIMYRMNVNGSLSLSLLFAVFLWTWDFDLAPISQLTNHPFIPRHCLFSCNKGSVAYPVRQFHIMLHLICRFGMPFNHKP